MRFDTTNILNIFLYLGVKMTYRNAGGEKGKKGVSLVFVKAKKEQVIPSIFIFLWILAINVVAPLMTEVPAWPMFLVSIFFFVMGEDPKNLYQIFGGGITGILLMYILSIALMRLQPVLGVELTKFLLLAFMLSLIIVGGNFLPIIFNNITFAFLTVGTVNLDPILIHNSCLGWFMMLTIGGAIILGGIFGIVSITNKMIGQKG